MARTHITKWVWNLRDKGYWEFQRQGGVLSALEDAGQRIAAAAGDGFEVHSETRSGKRGTPRVAVTAETFEAREAEAEHRALSKALDAGRG